MPERLPPLALAYHGVAEEPAGPDPHGLIVTAGDLTRHVQTLLDWGYELTTFGNLAALAFAGEGTGRAALTFDDGLLDNLGVLAPLLDRLGVPATVFVVPGWMGKPHPDVPWTRVMNEREVAALAAQGVEIGGHSMTHCDLTKLDFDGALREWSLCKASLEDLTGGTVSVASHPYGRATPETRRACRAAGFEAACRAGGRGSWEDLFDLPRQDMDSGAGLFGLRLKRQNRYEGLMRLPPVRIARTLGRRARGYRR